MKARETYIQTFEAEALPALADAYDAWRKDAGEAQIVETHYQANGDTFTLVVFYTE